MPTERKPSLVTRDSVLLAMAEHDGMGRAAFLEKYGFREARTHLVWNEGRSYDSKAIVGAAFSYLSGRPAPLRSDEFYGGQPSIRPLVREGFTFVGPEGTEPASPDKTPKNPLWTRDQVILALDPVHAMVEGDETTPDDLALVCSNCHRVIHKAKPWLSLPELKALLTKDG